MIKISNLTKTYKSKETANYTALNDMSFTLPQTGLVFVLGKSGSGKSTLLNILGTLDGLTSGSICIGDKEFSSFKTRDFDSYRNSFVGFVFQDACLIDDLNVYDNLKVELDLQHIKDDSAIFEALHKVELDNLEKRFPKELSTGQRQRVSLARALVKNSKVILADEPTGNVDNATGQTILNILKEQSQQKLVVVVSHNRDDAYKYASRIIEIQDGKITSDTMRGDEQNYENVHIQDDSIFIQKNAPLSQEDLNKINDSIKSTNGNVCIKHYTPAFKQNEQEQTQQKNTTFKKGSFSFLNTLKYSFKLYKTRVKYSTLLILLTSLLLIVLGITDIFRSYDENKEIAKNIDQNESMFITSQSEESARWMFVSDAQKSAMRQVYSGDIYDIYHISINADDPLNIYGLIDHGGGRLGKSLNGQPYITSSSFLVSVDDKFLIDKFGVDGQLTVLAGDINKREGIIITDYFAQSFIYYDPEHFSSYEDVINNQYQYKLPIDCIIKTDFLEKYAYEIENYADLCKDNPLSLAEYCADSVKYASIFTLNPNCLDVFCQRFTTLPQFVSNEKLVWATYYNLKCSSVDMPEWSFSSNEDYWVGAYANNYDGTVSLTYRQINEYFGTNLQCFDDVTQQIKDMFVGKSITFSCYADDNTLAWEESYTISEITDATTPGLQFDYLRLSPKNVYELEYNSLYRVGLLTQNSQDTYKLYKSLDENNLRLWSDNIGFYEKFASLVSIFKDVFLYLYIVVLVGIIVLVAIDAYSSIKRNSHTIGIMRAMGVSIGDLTLIFTLQLIFNCALIILLSLLGMYLLSGVFNTTLLNAISYTFKYSAPAGFQIIEFNLKTALTDISLIFALIFASTILSIFSIRKIKPIQIINTTH